MQVPRLSPASVAVVVASAVAVMVMALFPWTVPLVAAMATVVAASVAVLAHVRR